MRHPVPTLLTVALLSVAVSADADSRIRGWVTAIDAAAETIRVGDQTLSIRGMAVGGGPLEVGTFVKVKRGAIRVQPQRRPAEDQVVRFAATTGDNPGRVEFSHLRHFGALGQKQCATCHSPEMGLRARTPPPGARQPHGPTSRGRFCATCHDGATPLSAVGVVDDRANTPIFTAAKTPDPRSCLRCHAPAGHGADFTAAHGDVAEHGRSAECATCHRQEWTARDRQRHAGLLAAERTLAANPDDSQAALAVGPNNFCVHCHRADSKWR